MFICCGVILLLFIVYSTLVYYYTIIWLILGSKGKLPISVVIPSAVENCTHTEFWNNGKKVMIKNGNKYTSIRLTLIIQ